MSSDHSQDIPAKEAAASIRKVAELLPTGSEGLNEAKTVAIRSYLLGVADGLEGIETPPVTAETGPPVTSVKMPQTVGDVLPTDGEVGRFLIALLLALQDSIFARRSYLDAVGADHEYAAFYFARASVAHFHEAACSINRCEARPDVHAFINRLPKNAQAALRRAKKAHHTHRTAIGKIRHQASHYPSPTKEQADGWEEINDLVDIVKDDPFIAPQGKFRDIRIEIAEHIATARLLSATGDTPKPSNDPDSPDYPSNFIEVMDAVADAIGDLSYFTKYALDLALDEGGMRYLERTDPGITERLRNQV